MNEHPSVEPAAAPPYIGNATLRLVACGGAGTSALIEGLLAAGARAEPAARASDADDTMSALATDLVWRAVPTSTRGLAIAEISDAARQTRQLAAAAAISDLAVILAGARTAILPETRRQTAIAGLLGIRHLVLVVDDMDLIGYDRAGFEKIAEQWRGFAVRLGIPDALAIPAVARATENIVAPSTHMPWYSGPALLAHLESVDIARPAVSRPLRFPIRSVTDASGVRRLEGSALSGTVRPGDEVTILPSARPAHVARVLSGDDELAEADPGASVSLVLTEDVGAGRGDVIVAPEGRPEVADQVAADLVWFSDDPMLPGRPYWLRCGLQSATATITTLKYELDTDALDHLAARQLGQGGVARCNLSFSRPLVFEPHEVDRRMGSFVLVDRITDAVAGIGMIRFGLRRATNVHWQALAIDKATRAAQKQQLPACLWFTGLSGSGKSTIADRLERRLLALGHHTYILDGDNVRHGLNKDLGFTDTDRVENIRRVGEVARLMADAGLIVLVSFISPFREERRMARDLFPAGEFIEIHVDTPLAACEQRDPKGLYKKARQGLIKNFTGIDSDYEPPEHAELRLPTVGRTPDEVVEVILADLHSRGIITSFS